MSRRGKPPPKTKSLQAGKGRKASMPSKAGESLEEYVQAAAHTLLLPIEPEWLPAIRANLEVCLQLAASVAEFALPDEAEPAPQFRA
jgi:hypothetical protein